MKTTVIQIAYVAIVMLVVNSFSASAQDFFFDEKWEDGKIISRVRYENNYLGSYVKTDLHEYFFDESGELVTKEGYKWNKKQAVWTPDYRIERTKDPVSSVVTWKYFAWNKKTQQYGEPKELLIYQMNDSNDEFLYLAFLKDRQFTEEVNQTRNDRIFAELTAE